jgi:ABC-type glycerol-3-phosphate transport system substrate-binding protein
MTEKENAEKKNITRRNYLKNVGAAAVGLAVGAAGTYLSMPALTPPTSTVTSTLTETLTQTMTAPPITTAEVAEGGPGIDYYYDPSLKGTSINWLACNIPQTAMAQSLLSEFEDETGIKVNVLVDSEDSVNSKAALMFNAGSGDYDLIDATGFGAWAYGYYKSGFIDSLEPYLAKTPKGWNRDDIFPSVIEACSVDGELVNVATVITDYLCFWRKDLLSAAPKSLDEMKANAQKLNKPPNTFGWAGSAWAFQGFMIWETMLHAYGGRWFDEKYHPLCDSDASYNAAKYLSEMNKYCPAMSTNTQMDQSTNFAQGRVAQLSDFSVFWSSYIDPSSKVSNTAAYAPHPGAVSEPHMLAGITQVLNKFGKKKDASFSFISWLTSPRVQQQAASVGTIRKSVVNSATTKKLYPEVAEWNSWLANAKPTGSGAPVVAAACFPAMVRVTDFVSIVTKNIGGMLAGTMTYKQAMDTAQTQSVALFKEIGMYQP